MNERKLMHEVSESVVEEVHVREGMCLGVGK